MILSERNGDKGGVRCLLCPHSCVLAEGRKGICRVRESDGNTIRSLTYGIISGYSTDPIEKKPLYHFFPGKNILSVGSFGCNMRCDFCQNDEISQHGIQHNNYFIAPDNLVSRALAIPDNIGLAYTYNEPVIWFEYIMECSEAIKQEGLHNVMVTNGYVNKDPLMELLRYIDAFNIDLKSFDDSFYRSYTGSSLRPVLDTLVAVAEAGRHLEVTTLVIPKLNDTVEMMKREARWIAENLGQDTPLHISRYFPRYMREDPATPLETIIRLYETAAEHLRFVYTGNLPEGNKGSDTVCPSCNKILIKRSGYKIKNTGLTNEGRCSVCGEQIIRAENSVL